ncbi:MAG: CBS domain-containing protein, partial [Anaerolineae bacterium]|nr:CBS domain-containing protein [Anaerolineae bacterium]
GFTVLDAQGKLWGVVTLVDLEEALLSETLAGRTVADIATTAGLAVGYPDETMAVALWRMGVHGIGRLPVVDRTDPQRLVGVVRRADIVHAYEQALSRRTETSYRLKELREVHEGDIHVLKLDVADQHMLVGKSVLDIAQMLHDECILVSVRRGKQIIIPRGDTVFQAGDHITVLASATCAPDVEQMLATVSE